MRIPLALPSDRPLLRVDGVSAGYLGLPVLRSVSLSLAPGEALAVVGANGAGKSTLLRAIMGEIPLTAGQVELDGLPLAGVPTHQRVRLGLGYSPEGRHLFPDLTVEENLEMGAARAGGAQRRERVERMLGTFPKLRPLRSRACRLLSGGEQQMVAVGRALMGEPRLLLLDEPSAGLAPKVVGELYAALRDLHGAGLGVLLVEQNARAALRFAERAYVMEDGRITSAGPALQLLEDRRLVEAAYLGQRQVPRTTE
jgi:branched-chain amino acid transport system ATP-binding protein